MDWLHNRTIVRLPIGFRRLDVLSKVTEQELHRYNMMRIHEWGVQSLVLSPLPPLIRMIFSGCEKCEQCKKRATPVQAVHRNSINALEAVSIYLAVLQTNCVHTGLHHTDAAAYQKSIKLALGQVFAAFRETVEHNRTSRAKDWAALDADLRADPIRLDTLTRLASEVGPEFTVFALNLLETQVWLLFMTSAPKAKYDELFHRDIFTPSTSVAKWEGEDAREWIKIQSRVLRCVMCGDEDGTRFAKLPGVRLPSMLELCEVPDQRASFVADCHFILCIYYGLQFFKAEVEQTESVTSHPASQHRDEPVVVAESVV